MKLKTSDNRNVSVAKINGYTLEKVKKAKQYLDEIGSNKRNFDFKRLVEMYNDIKGTNEKAQGCRCQSPKYYNGLLNYYNYGKLTLINNGVVTEADFEDKKEEEAQPIENAENRIHLGSVSEPSEALKDDKVEDGKEEENKGLTDEEIKHQQMVDRMAKARAARKNKSEND